jgi:sulfite exporter TauE/SafE
MTADLVFALTGGLAGSLHCIGMCGAFPLALASSSSGAVLPRQLLYNAGRLNTLAAIGALSGAAGAALVARGPFATFERALAVVAGTFIVLVALEMLGAGIRITARLAALTHALLRHLLGGVIASRSPAAPLALGVFNAFLPCHLIYAFAARAASTASVGEGMLTMLAFGIGTVPAMLAVGVLGTALAPRLRARLSLLSAVVVLVLGVTTVLRGLDVLPHPSHRH